MSVFPLAQNGNLVMQIIMIIRYKGAPVLLLLKPAHSHYILLAQKTLLFIMFLAKFGCVFLSRLNGSTHPPYLHAQAVINYAVCVIWVNIAS